MKELTGNEFVKQLKAKGIKVNFSKSFTNNDHIISRDAMGFDVSGLPVNTRYEFFVSDGEQHSTGAFTTSPHEDTLNTIGIPFNPTIVCIFAVR